MDRSPARDVTGFTPARAVPQGAVPPDLAEALDHHGDGLGDYCRLWVGDAPAAVVAETIRSALVLARDRQAPPDNAGTPGGRYGRARLYAITRACCLIRLTRPAHGAASIAGAPPRRREADADEPVLAGLQALDRRQREVLELAFRHDLERSEIAAATGLGEERAGSLLAEAQDVYEAWVNAVLLGRASRARCAEGAELAAAWADNPGRGARTRLRVHVIGCATCSAPVGLTVDAGALLRRIPIAPLTDEQRALILDLDAAPALTGIEWGADGFPVQPDRERPPAVPPLRAPVLSAGLEANRTTDFWDDAPDVPIDDTDPTTPIPAAVRTAVAKALPPGARPSGPDDSGPAAAGPGASGPGGPGAGPATDALPAAGTAAGGPPAAFGGAFRAGDRACPGGSARRGGSNPWARLDGEGDLPGAADPDAPVPHEDGSGESDAGLPGDALPAAGRPPAGSGAGGRPGGSARPGGSSPWARLDDGGDLPGAADPDAPLPHGGDSREPGARPSGRAFPAGGRPRGGANPWARFDHDRGLPGEDDGSTGLGGRAGSGGGDSGDDPYARVGTFQVRRPGLDGRFRDDVADDLDDLDEGVRERRPRPPVKALAITAGVVLTGGLLWTVFGPAGRAGILDVANELPAGAAAEVSPTPLPSPSGSARSGAAPSVSAPSVSAPDALPSGPTGTAGPGGGPEARAGAAPADAADGTPTPGGSPYGRANPRPTATPGAGAPTGVEGSNPGGAGGGATPGTTRPSEADATKGPGASVAPKPGAATPIPGAPRPGTPGAAPSGGAKRSPSARPTAPSRRPSPAPTRTRPAAPPVRLVATAGAGGDRRSEIILLRAVNGTVTWQAGISTPLLQLSSSRGITRPQERDGFQIRLTPLDTIAAKGGAAVDHLFRNCGRTRSATLRIAWRGVNHAGVRNQGVIPLRVTFNRPCP